MGDPPTFARTTDRCPGFWVRLVLLTIGAAQTAALAGSPQVGAITRPARSLRDKVANISRARSGAVVRKVTVRKWSDRVEVQIEGSGALVPMATVLANPPRIVIDLPSVSYHRPRRIPVNAGDVEGVRVGMIQDSPPVTRVELELARPHTYELSSSGRMATVKIGAAAHESETASGPAGPPERWTAQAASLVSEPEAQKVALLSEPQTAPALQLQTTAVPQSPGKAPAQSAQTDQQTQAAQDVVLETPKVSASLPQVATAIAPTSPVSPETVSRDWGGEETTAHQAAKGHRLGVVRNITVSRDKGAVEIHIEGDQLPHPSVTTLSNPERIVIDLADLRIRHPRSLAVNAGDVRNVDVSLYLVNPLVTRVVVNLARSHRYRLLDSGNTLTVRIEDAQIETRERSKP